MNINFDNSDDSDSDNSNTSENSLLPLDVYKYPWLYFNDEIEYQLNDIGKWMLFYNKLRRN